MTPVSLPASHSPTRGGGFSFLACVCDTKQQSSDSEYRQALTGTVSEHFQRLVSRKHLETWQLSHTQPWGQTHTQASDCTRRKQRPAEGPAASVRLAAKRC